MNPQTTGYYSNSEFTMHLIKEKLEQFQSKLMQDVQTKMDYMVEGLIKEIQRHEIQTTEFRQFAVEQYNQIWSNRKMNNNNNNSEIDSSNSISNGKSTPVQQSNKSLSLPEKIFMPRESYLTALLEVKHMRSIYNFFIVIFIFVFLNNGIHDYFLNGTVKFGFETITTGFGRFHLAVLLWLTMQLATIGLFFSFQVWAKIRLQLRNIPSLMRFWDYMCVVLFISFLHVFFYTKCLLCPKLDLGLISACCVLMEAIRLVMKMHAFVRTNAAKQIKGKEKVSDEENEEEQKFIPVPLPEFQNYVYFLFAPTLIYRDTYPRTTNIRWNFVGMRLLEVIAIIFLLSQIHERHMRPLFIDWCKTPPTVSNIAVSSFGMMMPGLVTILCGFYCILHSWMNLGAEVTRFADRMFYRDWWTTSNYTTYYRHWNIVVHDYLYEYVFRDVYYLTNGSKTLATMTVFLTSAIMHEVIISFGLRFFYPVMIFFFIGIGGLLILVTKHVSKTAGNMIILAGCAMGNGLMMAFYFMEYYARQNCHVGYKFSDYLVPVSLSCTNQCS